MWFDDLGQCPQCGVVFSHCAIVQLHSWACNLELFGIAVQRIKSIAVTVSLLTSCPATSIGDTMTLSGNLVDEQLLFNTDSKIIRIISMIWCV